MSDSQETPILIVGAGPAGLAVAGRLRHQGLDFEIIEKTDKVGSSWHGHYDRLCLHTVKQYSHLPHLPFPKDYPLYVPRDKLIEYFESYTTKFRIKPYFNKEVKTLARVDGIWKVQTGEDNSIKARHVIIATGSNHIPFCPHWAGQEDYGGRILHSRDYKNVEPFKNKRVLVVGMGNTGAEIALDMAENDIDVTMSVRSPVSIVPRDVNGRPVQVTAMTLAKIPFGLGDWLGTVIRKIVIGDLSKYGLPMLDVHPAVQLKETGKTPVIDLGTIDYIKSGKITVAGDIKVFTKTGVGFQNGDFGDFDTVILCTGYKAGLSNLIEGLEPELDKFGLPKGPIASDDNGGLYFVGFDNYKLGGLLGTIFNDSEKVVSTISSRLGK